MTETAFQRNLREHEAGTHPPEPRADVDTASLKARYPELAAVSTADFKIPGRHGPIPARQYSTDASARVGYIWVHGGSWIGGSLDMAEANWPSLVIASQGIPVVSVDYRKALNGVHYPVPSDDVLDAWNWLQSHPELLSVPADRMHLGGASAGGNLVAGVTLRLRDGAGRMPASLVLVYPALHGRGPATSAELTATLHADGQDIDDQPNEAVLNYAGSDAALDEPYAFAANDPGAGLPPLFVLASEFDILRASAEGYAAQLAAVGGDVTLVVEPGVRHGHFHQPHDVQARASVQRVADWLHARAGTEETGPTPPGLTG